MKFRTDFVTNSSSSSYIVVRIQSKSLCDIAKKFGENFCIKSEKDNLIRVGEEDIPVKMPETKEEFVGAFLPFVMDFEELEEIVEDDGTVKYELALDEDDYDEDDNEIQFVKTVMNSVSDIANDMEFAEVVIKEQDYGGTSTRFEKENYTKDELEEVYTKIREEKGYDSNDEITDDDFEEYVGDKVGIYIDTATYTKKDGLERDSKYFVVTDEESYDYMDFDN